MKIIIAAMLALSAGTVHAQTVARDYPSCDLKAQHVIKGQTGGTITDPRQAHISVRANILQADLSTARKARYLTQTTADSLYKRVDAVRVGANHYTKQQGFLSAAEVASYDRELDAIALKACRR